MLTARKLALVGIAGIGIALVAAAPAQAQATRTWVSGVGDDVNPCSRTAPCKTFAGAISKTAAGGEINCLDPGGFGAVTITKSMTIDCTGTLGSVLASGTTGVLVNGANVNVVLRGLTINGAPPTIPALFGVRFLQGASLTVVDCIINGVAAAAPNGIGISFIPSTTAELHVTNTQIVNSGTGILISPTGSGSAAVTLESTFVSNSVTDNLRIATTSNSGPGIFLTAKHSIFSGGQNGISVITPAGTNFAVAKIVNSTIQHNSGVGILASGATVRADVSNSIITNNGTGVSAIGGGVLSTYLDNVADRNGADGTFSGTIVKK